MQTLARLFGRSPFAPIQTHMSKVAACVKEAGPLFEALKNKDYSLVEQIAEKISKLEHDADLTKNDIRNHLPSGLFMPVARENLLDILVLQDNIADKVEDVSVLLTLRPLEIESNFEKPFLSFLNKNLEAFQEAHRIIEEFGELVESSFGGQEAEKVVKMVEKVAYKEHESDVLQHALLKIFFRDCDKMQYQTFYLWLKIIQMLAALSDESERLANRVRMILEVK